jgi:hypothetical protein
MSPYLRIVVLSRTSLFEEQQRQKCARDPIFSCFGSGWSILREDVSHPPLPYRAELKGRPDIKPSGMDKGTEPVKSAKTVERRGRGKMTPRVSIEDQVVKAVIPPGSRFKCHEPFLVRDLGRVDG